MLLFIVGLVVSGVTAFPSFRCHFFNIILNA